MEVNRFMDLFQGYEFAHGQYRVQKKEADGKMSGRAVTVSEPATIENYRAHLNGGDYILGIMLTFICLLILPLLLLIWYQSSMSSLLS